MFRQLISRVGTAALAAALALGVGTTATAAPPHHGGHAGHGGGHAVGHIGGYHGGINRGGIYQHGHTAWNNFGHYGHHGNIYRGPGVYHGGHYGHGYSAYRYPYSYGYRYPYSSYRYGYRYPYSAFGLGLGLTLGRLGYGYPGYYNSYAYPSYFGYYGYPSYGTYFNSTDYYLPPYGPGVVTEAVPPTTESYYPPAESAPTTGSARVTVQVPADATLWIDGQPTRQTGAVREFVSPDTLQPGRTYSYTLRAQWVENGQTVTRERTVEFQAGNSVIVNLTQPGA